MFFKKKRSARIKRALSSFASTVEDQERIGNEVSDQVVKIKQDMEVELQSKVIFSQLSPGNPSAIFPWFSTFRLLEFSR